MCYHFILTQLYLLIGNGKQIWIGLALAFILVPLFWLAIDKVGSRFIFNEKKTNGRQTGKSFGNILMYLLASTTSNGEMF